MFKIILASVLLVISCTISQAWVMRAVYHNDAHPGKCYVNERLILLPGQKAKSPEGCSLIHCGNANGEAQVTGCGSIMEPENCRWAGYENVEADYPICCVEKFVCDDPIDEANAKKLQDHIRDMYTRQLEDKEN